MIKLDPKIGGVPGGNEMHSMSAGDAGNLSPPCATLKT